MDAPKKQTFGAKLKPPYSPLAFNPKPCGEPDKEVPKESSPPSEMRTEKSHMVKVNEDCPDPPLDLPTLITESLNNLITLIPQVNPPEKIKIIGKLKGALELFKNPTLR